MTISTAQEQLPASTDQQSKMTTAELNELLHAHFIKPEDRLSSAGAGAIYLTEVTSPDGGRRADAVHVGLWQSRGAGRIDVCELKTSRADFRRELDQPAKAEAWWPYSTTFSIVSPGEHITPPEELPPGWGLVVPKANSRRFRMVVKAAEREPKLTIGLLMTLLKCTETTRTSDLSHQANQFYVQRQEQEQRLRRELGSAAASPRTRERLKLLDRIEEVMGVKLDTETWMSRLGPDDAAQALKGFAVGQIALASARQQMERRAQEFERIASNVTEEARALRKALRTDREAS